MAALGRLPAALATDVGTGTQRPVALVIVSGLFTRKLRSLLLMAALYALAAGDRGRLALSPAVDLLLRR